MKDIMLTRLNTKIPSVAHSLYDADGNIVAQSAGLLRVRGKVRCVGSDGSVLNASNNTIYPGRRFILEALFRLLPDASQVLTLNTILDINAQDAPANQTDLLQRRICLVGVGDGGASLTFGQVFDVRANDNNLVNIIPMRTVATNSDLTPDERDIYFMRKVNTYGPSQFYDYYLKRVASPVIKAIHQNVNFTPNVTNNDPELPPSDPLVLYNVQIYTALDIPITKDDIKGYYQATNGNINKARFNEMALYIGIPTTVTSPSGETYTDYIAVEAFSRLSFNNRPMDSPGSSYSFLYYLMT